MAIKEFTNLEQRADLFIKKLSEYQSFFEKKIKKQEEEGTEPEDKNNWWIAYNNRYGTLRPPPPPAGSPPNNHNYIGTVDNIYRDLASIKDRVNLMMPQIRYMEDQLKTSLKTTNLEIKENKELYESVDEKYRMNRNQNSAMSLLKIDSYDKNIEENFYIMYYLLSYGILGFFIYKLLKI